MVYSMTNDKGIRIRNIYWMLSYAFQVLRQSAYESIAAEEFDGAEDLFAAILAKGVACQLKQGLYREYVAREESLSVLRGKLVISETIRNRMQRKQRLSCEFDELSENNLYNQILKTTMLFLEKSKIVRPERRQALHKLLLLFSGVALLSIPAIPWRRLHFQRCNQNYEMLLNVCFFVLDGMIQTTEEGNYRVAGFSEKHMARLYERFVLEYYRRHHTYLSDVRSSWVEWNRTEDREKPDFSLLPVMKTDVTLRFGEKTLILDTKYYGQILQCQFDKETLRSSHLYQMFAYVKNMDSAHTGNVSGILLYAKTGESITPDCKFCLDGNWLGAKTLDLNTDFHTIVRQLDELAFCFFGSHEIDGEIV